MGSVRGPTPVAIALGSNLGDRHRFLDKGIAALTAVLDAVRVSSTHETAYVGAGAQPRYLNAAAVGWTRLEPDQLLARLLEIEAEFGRTRPYAGAPRSLDLDLILYGSETRAVPGLTVPHPRFRERRFVLAPLAEIAPGWVDPETGLTVQALLMKLDV